MEKPKVTNDWITLAEQRNGLTVQRKFGGLATDILEEKQVSDPNATSRTVLLPGSCISQPFANRSIDDSCLNDRTS